MESNMTQYMGMGSPSLTDSTLPAAAVVRSHVDLIENFANQYLMDPGISLAFIEAVAQEFFAPLGGNPHSRDIKVMSDWIGTIGDLLVPPLSAFTGVTDVNMIIAAGAAFDFVVRYARLIDPKVLPPDVIPPNHVVDAVLELFHERKAYEAANRHNQRS